jgi:hypothetical protein
MAIVVQKSAKDKRSSFAKIGQGQIQASRDFGYAIFAPDLFDSFAPRVGALLNQQLLITAWAPSLAAHPKICLQPAVLQRIENIVGDPAGHRVPPLPPTEGTLVARGGTFYVDRTLKAKDRSPADAIPEDHWPLSDADVVAFSAKHLREATNPWAGYRLFIQVFNLGRHHARDRQ